MLWVVELLCCLVMRCIVLFACCVELDDAALKRAACYILISYLHVREDLPLLPLLVARYPSPPRFGKDGKDMMYLMHYVRYYLCLTGSDQRVSLKVATISTRDE